MIPNLLSLGGLAAEQPGKNKVFLEEKHNEKEKRVFIIVDQCIIGLEGDIAISAVMPTVSRKHCVVFLDNGKLCISDLGSKNGTYILRDNKPIVVPKGSVEPLQPRDIIRLARENLFSVV